MRFIWKTFYFKSCIDSENSDFYFLMNFKTSNIFQSLFFWTKTLFFSVGNNLIDFNIYLMVSKDTIHLNHTPPSFGTRGRLILDIPIATYSIYRYIYFFSLFYSTGEPANGDKPRDVVTTLNGLLRHKMQLALGLYHCLIRGLSKKEWL